jgi:arginine-tRNA-protein transferase
MYTINCHSLDFKLSKSQKKVLRKFNSHLGLSDSKEKKCIEDYFQSTPGFSVKFLKVGTEEFFATLEEEHELYKKYQMKIHEDSESDCSIKQFKRFLCESPLTGGVSLCCLFIESLINLMIFIDLPILRFISSAVLYK